MRNLLIARVCGADSDLIAATPDQRPGLAKAAAQFSEEDLTRFFQILLQTDEDLRRKPDPRVHLEMGLLRLINASRLAPLEELLADLRGGTPAATATGGAARGVGAAPRPPVARAESFSTVANTGAARSATRDLASPGFTSASTPARAETRTETAASFAPAAKPAVAASAPMTAAQPAASAEAEDASNRTVAAANVNGPAARTDGITEEQVAEIKSVIQAQQKFLGELVEHSNRWELEGAELRIYFSPEKRPFAEMLEGRESLEKIRAASSKVLGRAVRVCAKVEGVAAAAAAGSRGTSGTQELRAQFESDPMVRSMLQRFGGKISEVRRPQGES
jgi:DNA polymerase-3 subunit gamma/tau